MFYNCETLFYLINFYDYEKSKAYIKNIFFNCKSLILNSELIKFENENKILFEFILIGDHVGKTSLLYKLTQGDFKGYFVHSGIDFKNILIKVDIEKNNEIKKKNICKLAIWDASSFEPYKIYNKSVYKNINVCIILYDISSRKSFDNIKNYYDEFKKENSNAIIYLIGNKSDLIEEREVSINEAKEKCDKYNIIWEGEYSAKTCNQGDLLNIFKKIIIKYANT